MNESEFRRLVRAAVGEPPPAPAAGQLHASLVARIDRRRQRLVAAAAFGLAAVVVVALLGGYRLLNAGQRPTTPAATPSSTPVATPTAAPTATPTGLPSASPAPTPTPAPTASSPRFTTFQLPGANPIPAQATAGPDGAVWYMDDRSPLSIVRISPSGTTQAFPLQGSASD